MITPAQTMIAELLGRLDETAPEPTPPAAVPTVPAAPGNGSTASPAAAPAVRWWPGLDLMAADFPEPRWAVPGLVTEGANLLVGPPKVGKSWLALGVALAVAAGGRALGQVPVDRGKVALLALEDTPRRLQARARMLLDGQPMPVGLGVAFEAPRLGEGLVEALDATDTGGLRLVVIDVLARIRPSAGRSDSAYDRDYAAMSAVKAWSDRRCVRVLVVHHTRKASSDDYMDLVSGTHGLAGAADTILVMRRARSSADAVLHVTGRDVEEAEHAMRFDATRGAWTLLEGPAGDYDLSDTRRRVLDLLRQDGPMRPKAIAEALGIEHEAAKKHTQRMARDGQLDTDGTGYYFVPTADPLSPLSPLSPDPLTSDNGHGPRDTPAGGPVPGLSAADQREPRPGDSGDTRDTPHGDDVA